MYVIQYMRFHQPLEDLWRGRTSLRVLQTIFRFPTKAFTGRELSREAGVHPSEANAVLELLRTHGLIDRRTVGRAHLWELRGDHYLARRLRPILEVDEDALPNLRRVILEHLGSHPGVKRLVLFGSIARGEERPTSDVDLFVVVPDAGFKRKIRALLPALRSAIDATFGNPLRELIYSDPEYERKRRSPLVRNIEREGITLLGGAKNEGRKARPG